MKIGLTITDATPEEIQDILNKLNDGEHKAFYPQLEHSGQPQPVPEGYGSTGHQDTYAPESELDANGLPWDERIHASTKTKTEKGVWKKARGVQEPAIKEVEAELRAKLNLVAPVMANPAEMFGPNGPQAVQHVQAVQPVQHVQQPVTDPRIIAPVAVATPQPMPVQVAPTAAPQGYVQDFQSLMNLITQLFTAQTIDPAYMQNLCGRMGAVAITDIMQDPNRVAQAFAMLKQDGKIA